jgi:hypothetical protein
MKNLFSAGVVFAKSSEINVLKTKVSLYSSVFPEGIILFL